MEVDVDQRAAVEHLAAPDQRAYSDRRTRPQCMHATGVAISVQT
jgi:hypothetical protein